MKDMANDLLLKVLKTPAVAEQIRKNLVNRDISIKIDGKEYQITRREATDDELSTLKADNWDLQKALRQLSDAVCEYRDGKEHSADLDRALDKAWEALGIKK